VAFVIQHQYSHVVIVAGHGADQAAVLPIPNTNGLVVGAGKDPRHLQKFSSYSIAIYTGCIPLGERTLSERNLDGQQVSQLNGASAATRL
jgi:hypothetical protein